MEDEYAAYCLDEVCDWMLGQLDEGKRPFFGRASGMGHGGSGNAAAIAALKQLGAEVRTHGD